MKNVPSWRGCVAIACLIAAVFVVGWSSPAAAAGRSFDEAPMRVVTEGLRAEEQLRRQAEMSRRLGRELPEDAMERAFDVSLTQDEVAAVEKSSRQVSPLKIGLVKAMTPGIVVAGLDFEKALDRAPFVGEAGVADRTGDGGLVWAAVVRSEGAGAIRLHLQDLSLPSNAALYVYNRHGHASGPYTGAGPDFSGDLWTTAVFGSEVILQLRMAGPVSDADLRAVSFRVTEAGLITERFVSGLRQAPERPRPVEKANWPCGNANCLVDATCTNVAAANPAKLATAKMEWISGAFIYTCTGGLLNDNNPSSSIYFLTANHCLSGNKAAKNMSLYWQYATASCDGTCPVNGGWPLVTTGASVAATGRKGDFTLLQLTTAPPAGSVLLGWTNAPVANTNGAALYRVSNPNFGPQVYSAHSVDTGAGTCTGWPRGERIYSRDLAGATDGGSSGSPVLNAASQVVGQLTGACGFDPNNVCAGGPGEANATVDGALAFYYSTVQPFLNP